ncbi:MAG: hypothetical protein WAO76_17390 [Georgfuchsia sp.]
MSLSTIASSEETLQAERQEPNAGLVVRWVWRTLIFVLVSLISFLAWLVAYGNLYKSGSQLGYNLGLVGGVLMATLLAYPLRKRLPFLEKLGSMPSWFKYHMVLGIVGPLLIMFHSTFKIGSMNGRVAFYAMILVMASGIVGRFIYRQVHIGLYGRELTLADAEAELKTSLEGIDSAIVLQPEFLQRLKDFRDNAFVEENRIWHHAWRFCTLSIQGKLLVHSISGPVRKAIAKSAAQQH